MYNIEFSRLEDGLYVIADENDQRLLCIGTLLFDDDLRGGIKKMLEYAPEIGIDKAHNSETELYKVRLSPDAVYGLLIKFIDKREPGGRTRYRYQS